MHTSWKNRDWQSHERKIRHEMTEPITLPPCQPKLWPDFIEYLEGRNLSVAVARGNNWYPSDCAGDSESRIVIPALRSDRRVFWQARATDPSVKKRYQSPKGPRGDAVVRIDPDYSYSDSYVAALVEGPMDALAVAEIGVMGIALMGNSPSEEVMKHVANLIRGFRKLVIVSDADALTESTQTSLYLRTRMPIKTELWYPYPYKDLAKMPAKERFRRFPR